MANILYVANILIPISNSNDPNLVSVPMLRESLGTGLLHDQQDSTAIADGFERGHRNRNSTPQWGVLSILIWSLITGCILSVFAGVLGCQPSLHFSETICSDLPSTGHIHQQFEATPRSHCVTTAVTPPIG